MTTTAAGEATTGDPNTSRWAPGDRVTVFDLTADRAPIGRGVVTAVHPHPDCWEVTTGLDDGRSVTRYADTSGSSPHLQKVTR